MPTLLEARQALADAVTAGGLQCLPHSPDNPSPPIAFVDDMVLDFAGAFGGAGSFCLPATCAATIVTVAQRNDRPGSMAFLESLVPAVLDQLYGVPGVRVVAANSGQLSLGGADLPAVTYTVSFHL